MADSTTPVPVGEIVGRPDGYQCAQACAALGWRVLPLRRDTKQPALRRWPELATTDPDTLEEWWCGGRYAGCLAGVATGHGSDLWVLDVDVHGVDGHGALAALEADHGALPPTWTVRTPSGGQHRYWRWPDDDEKSVRGSQSDTGLDVRGWHGQVVAPGTWLGGHQYEPLDPVVRLPLPMAPDWLVGWADAQRANTNNGNGTGDHRPSAERDADWAETAAGIGPGGRHQYLFTGLCSMRARGVDPDEMLRLALEAASRFGVGGRLITEDYVRYQVADVVDRYPPGGRDGRDERVARYLADRFGGTP
jgi:hypothetical protein